MTDLQFGLIGLGGAAVVGVFAYNKWQEWRHRKVAEQVLQQPHDDVLLQTPAAERRRERATTESPVVEARREPVLAGDADEVRIEPQLGASGDEPQVEVAGQSAVVTEVFAPPAVEAEADEGVEIAAGEVPPELLDPRIDFTVVMELVEPVAASQILYSQRDALMRISKPVIWVGFNERQREWEVIAPTSERAYRRLRIGLQLADRRGPVSKADFSIFVASMQQLADELMAVADMAPRQGVIERAVELDRFCADVDLEIGVHLITRGAPFTGTKVRALAEAAGMVLGSDGLFTRYDDDGRAQFKLQNYESTLLTADTIKNVTTHGLTFLLDVPRVDHGDRVFFQMVDNARRFADALQGQLVDDNRQPLNEAQLDRIKREYVVKTQATMTKYGLPAGSPQALRLFS